MITDITARTEVTAELESSADFTVTVDHIDEASVYGVALGSGVGWFHESDFNELLAVMKKAVSVKKAGIKAK